MKKIALGKRARKHKGHEALVDDADFDELAQYNWYASYAAKIDKYSAHRQVYLGYYTQQTIIMHRWLTGATELEKVVHLNGDTLDNRRENLQVVRIGREVKDEIEDRDNLDV